MAGAGGRRQDGLLRDNGKAGFLMAACGEDEGWGHPQCVPPPQTPQPPWQVPVLADHRGKRRLASKPTETEVERTFDKIPGREEKIS